jgi:hypothetical protein
VIQQVLRLLPTLQHLLNGTINRFNIHLCG